MWAVPPQVSRPWRLTVMGLNPVWVPSGYETSPPSGPLLLARSQPSLPCVCSLPLPVQQRVHQSPQGLPVHSSTPLWAPPESFGHCGRLLTCQDLFLPLDAHSACEVHLPVCVVHFPGSRAVI